MEEKFELWQHSCNQWLVTSALCILTMRSPYLFWGYIFVNFNSWKEPLLISVARIFTRPERQTLRKSEVGDSKADLSHGARNRQVIVILWNYTKIS